MLGRIGFERFGPDGARFFRASLPQ